MAASQTSTSGTGPVACILTPADLAAQGKRWEQLITRAMTEHAETAYGLRICFRPEPGAEDELRALVAVESGCCAWATWTVRRNAGTIVLDVRSTTEGAAILHSMFTPVANMACPEPGPDLEIGD